jgi:hypothetical protein
MFHTKTAVTILLCGLTLASSLFAGSPAKGKDALPGAAVTHIADAGSMRVAGEQRFHANCGRCHASPQKFPPRMMATILRHMRVRATITDQDQRLILFYMTQ